ncbi:MAG: glycosyltransferase family 4 protein [Planctomycetota bacterium]|jgi:glycosyltransferase involved in cell wall biosynthesis
MRILFIAHYFQPEPPFIGLPFAKKLASYGHEVEVLTGFPNYPDGKIYEGYHLRPLQREEIDGIGVIRVPLYPSHDRSAMRRFLSYSSLSISQAMIGPFVVKPADIAFVCQGPATIGLPAWIIKMLRRVPFVFNIQDIWPESLVNSEMFTNKLGIKIVDRWCRFVYKRASKIVVITEGFKQKLCERGVPKHKIEVIYNWCDETHFCNAKRDESLAKELGMEGKFNVLFAGNMGLAQAISAVLDAAALVRDECPDVQFVFMGTGVEVEKLKNKAKEMNLNNVLFHDRRPRSEIGAVLCLADVLLVHLRNDPVFDMWLPSKTQAYMATGRPILMGIRGDARELVEKAKAGLPFEPENPRSLADAVKKFRSMPREQLDQMGDNGKEFYKQNLAFDIAARKYEQVFKSILNNSKNKKK